MPFDNPENDPQLTLLGFSNQLRSRTLAKYDYQGAPEQATASGTLSGAATGDALLTFTNQKGLIELQNGQGTDGVYGKYGPDAANGGEDITPANSNFFLGAGKTKVIEVGQTYLQLHKASGSDTVNFTGSSKNVWCNGWS